MAMKGRIRVKLSSYDNRIIDQSTEKIIDTAVRTGAKVVGPVPLPTNVEKITVIKGPHIDKRSGDHFEIRTHRRLVDILEPTAQTIDQLSHLNLPAGVGIELKM